MLLQNVKKIKPILRYVHARQVSWHFEPASEERIGAETFIKARKAPTNWWRLDLLT